MAEMERKINGLEEKLVSVRQTADEKLSNMIRQVQETKVQSDKLRQTNTQYETEKKQMNQTINGLQKAQTAMKKLEKDLLDTQCLKSQAEVKLSEVTAALDQARKTASASKTQLEAEKKRSDEAENAFQRAEKKMNRMIKELLNAQEQKEKTEVKVSNLTAALIQAQITLSSMKRKLRGTEEAWLEAAELIDDIAAYLKL